MTIWLKLPVNKKTIAAAFISALLITALTIPLFVNFAAANPIGAVIPASPILSARSPAINKVYNTTSIPLHFKVYESTRTSLVSWFWIVSVDYWLDGVLQGQLTGADLPKEYSFKLTGLSEGKHRVNIKVTYLDPYDNSTNAVSGTICFFVDTVAPTIGFLQAEKAYGSADMPLNFTLNEPVSWIGYSLNGKEIVNVTDTAALTRKVGRDEYCIVLSGLSAGAHSLTVYAEDAVGNIGASEPFHFTIATEAQPETEQFESEPSFPTNLIAVAVIVSAAIVSFGLVAYFLRRKGKRSEA